MHPILKAFLGLMIAGACLVVGAFGGCFAGIGLASINVIPGGQGEGAIGVALVAALIGAVVGLAGGVFLAIKLLAGK